MLNYQRKNGKIVPQKINNNGSGTTDRDASFAELRHDIRSPMHVVRGMAGVLAASTPLTSQQQEIIATLMVNAERLNTLIGHLFDLVETGAEGASSEQAPETVPVKYDGALAAAHRKAQHGTKPCVLLVEDYAPNSNVAAAYLQSLGYDYEIAESGVEAVDKFLHNHFDAVIMDIQMPEMDGLEAARRMRDMEKQKNLVPTPILATTGRATADDRILCLKAGINDYLSKPFQQDQLKDKLESLLPVGYA